MPAVGGDFRKRIQAGLDKGKIFDPLVLNETILNPALPQNQEIPVPSARQNPNFQDLVGAQSLPGFGPVEFRGCCENIPYQIGRDSFAS